MTNWLETEGSPLIIIEETNLMDWNPIKNYKKICTVKDYVGVIKVNNKDVLVFGDEPMALKLVNKDNEILIIRWVYAPNEVIVENIIKTLECDKLPIIESVSINWNSNNLVLFDSLKTYDENENIKINTNNKSWKVHTLEYKNEDTHLIIHRIKK